MLVSAVQMDVVAGDVRGNMARAYRHVEVAVRRGSRVILLPEMWSTGFYYSDLVGAARAAYEPTLAFLRDVAREAEAWILGTIPQPTGEGVYNAMHWVSPSGEVAAWYRKAHLFIPTGEDERFVAGREAPGAVDIEDARAGGLVCFDIRFPEMARRLTLDGAQVLFVPAQFPHPRVEHWETLLKARAIENQVWVVAANRVGESGSLSYFGFSMVVDPWGRIVEGDDSEREGVVSAVIDLELVDEVRRRLPCPRRPDLYGSLTPAAEGDEAR